MAIEQNLVKIGLNPKEAQLYLAALELGPTSVVELAKKSGLKRTTVYEILGSLKGHGLISEAVSGKRRRFIAESPEYLFALKKQELDALRGILPTLQALHNVAIEKPAVRFYHGKEDLAQVFYDMILKTDPVNDRFLAIEGKASMNLEQMGEEFFIDLLSKKKKQGLESLTLSTMTEEELEILVKQFPPCVDHPIEIRLLADKETSFTMNLYLFQNKVALIATDQLLALVVENKRLHLSFKFLFDILWTIGKPTKYTIQ